MLGLAMPIKARAGAGNETYAEGRMKCLESLQPDSCSLPSDESQVNTRNFLLYLIRCDD